MIKTIFIDMDGVLTNFVKGAQDAEAIDGKKVDWGKIHNLGSDFWANLEWVNGSKDFYKWLVQFAKEQHIELCILSAVNYDAGVSGKNAWLDTHCPEISMQCRYFTKAGKLKSRYAAKDALLIDDFGKNVEAFIMAGGLGVKFENPVKAKDEIIEAI